MLGKRQVGLLITICSQDFADNIYHQSRILLIFTWLILTVSDNCTAVKR